MLLILIPILIIAAIVGIYKGDVIWNNLNVEIPEFGGDGFDVRQFLGSPGGSSLDSNSPLRQLGD